jgi:hypothetical protein
MKLIYVAGPYRAATGWGIEQNIQRARALGAEVAALGAYPVIPHSNTAHMDGLATDELWLRGTLELMRRCDAVIFTPDWRQSSGARDERTDARRLDMPRFYDVAKLRAWLAMETQPNYCSTCDAPDPDGDPEGTLCRTCVEAMVADADDDARERAIDQRVEEHLDRERERRHARGEPAR